MTGFPKTCVPWDTCLDWDTSVKHTGMYRYTLHTGICSVWSGMVGYMWRARCLSG